MSKHDNADDLEMAEAERLLAEDDERTANSNNAATIKDDRFDADLEDLEQSESLPVPVTAQNATSAVSLRVLVDEEEGRELRVGEGRGEGGTAIVGGGTGRV